MAKKTTLKIEHEILNKGIELSAGKDGDFLIQKQIGKGGFGIIYSATKKQEKDSIYAVKTEPKGNGPLFVEISVLRRIAKTNDLSIYKKSKKLSHLGIPDFIAMGFFSNTRFLVIPFYKTSLEAGLIENKINCKGLKQMCAQMVDALEYIHSMNYVHSDLKSENILTNDFTRFYLVDYGIASLYIIKENHVIEKPDKKLMNNGTLEFTSLDSHNGLPLSRRSDLQEFTINIFSWICRTVVDAKRENFHDSLPWGSIIKNSKKEKEIYEKVKKAKQTNFSQPDIWCTNLGIPKQESLVEIAKYSYTIGYDERPDYVKIKNLIEKIDLDVKNSKEKSTTKTFDKIKVRSSLRTKKNEPTSESDLSSEKKKPGAKRGKVVSPINDSPTKNILGLESDLSARKKEEFSLRENGKPIVLNYHIESVLRKATRSSPRKISKTSDTKSTQTSPELLEKYKRQVKKNNPT